MRRKILVLGIAMIQLHTSFAALPVATTKNDTASASYRSKEDEAMVKNAIQAFKHLSKAERKARIGEAKQLMKQYNASKPADQADTNTILMAILCVLMPPLAVFVHERTLNDKFWISLILTFLIWLPGVIYALVTCL